MKGESCRSILVVCLSDADEAALDAALERARNDHARLTLVVPIGRPFPLVGLACLDQGSLLADLELHACRTARRLAARVGPDVPLVLRCPSPVGERRLARELENGAYDLCVAGTVGPDLWSLRTRASTRLLRAARRCGIATLVAAPAVAA